MHTLLAPWMFFFTFMHSKIGDMFAKDKTKKSHYQYYWYVCCFRPRAENSSSSTEKGRWYKIIREAKIKKEADLILQFLKGTNAAVVMESGYNYQYLYMIY